MTDEEFLIRITTLHHIIKDLHARVMQLEHREKAIILTEVEAYDWRKALLDK